MARIGTKRNPVTMANIYAAVKAALPKQTKFWVWHNGKPAKIGRIKWFEISPKEE
jgi:hypothetical protein